MIILQANAESSKNKLVLLTCKNAGNDGSGLQYTIPDDGWYVFATSYNDPTDGIGDGTMFSSVKLHDISEEPYDDEEADAEDDDNDETEEQDESHSSMSRFDYSIVLARGYGPYWNQALFLPAGLTVILFASKGSSGSSSQGNRRIYKLVVEHLPIPDPEPEPSPEL